MEASCTSASLFAGADVETDCLTFVEEIPRKEVQQIEVEHIKYTRSYYRKESAASSQMDQSQHVQFAE
jgi:hypothetical protein